MQQHLLCVGTGSDSGDGRHPCFPERLTDHQRDAMALALDPLGFRLGLSAAKHSLPWILAFGAKDPFSGWFGSAHLIEHLLWTCACIGVKK